jgi:uncharacterized small protein (DUF1192 family)
MDWSVVIVALISGGAGIISSLIVARNTSEKLMHQLELGQAVQNERVSNYQRTTNEKIDELRTQVASQAEYGTKIALLEAEVKRLREERQ